MPFSDLPKSVQAEYERIGRERELASQAADRAARRDLIRVCLEMLGWAALGVFVAGIGFWVTDYQLGRILLVSGMIINVGGVAFSIWAAYLRGEARGDW